MPIFRRTKAVLLHLVYIGLVLLDVVVAVVGRCLVGCEHYEVFCSSFKFKFQLNRTLHSAHTLQDSAPQPLPTTSNKTRPIYTKCSNRAFFLLKMGIMMPETF